MSRDNTDQRTTRKKALIVLGVCLALLGGLGTWFLLGRERAAPCNGLPEDERVRRAVGSTVSPGMSCAALGEAIVKATTSDGSGRHTQAQAQALKDVLFAVAFGHQDRLTLDPALRVPLATALADHATDLHEMLAGLDSTYVVKAGPEVPPWKAGGTYHVAVYSEVFRDTVRAVSEDPHAYALLRSTETRTAAQRLAAVPASAVGYSLSVPPTANGRALGILDGIADAITQGQDTDQANKWRGSVWDSLLSERAAPRSYREDPAGHLMASWLQELRSAPEKDRSDRLRAQGVDMAHTWLQARKASEATQQGLLAGVERSALSAYREIKP